MGQPKVILFLKAPRPGFAKTRLAASVGAEKAIEIYRVLVERQIREVPESWDLEVRFAPEDALGEFQNWLGPHLYYRPQSTGDLGDRLKEAVLAAFSEGSSRVICIGADCPELNREDLFSAERCLDGGTDLVFGPAEDGGYYLVGLASMCAEIFTGVGWSTEKTLSESLENARRMGREVSLLEEKFDVDEITDWEKFCGLQGVRE